MTRETSIWENNSFVRPQKIAKPFIASALSKLQQHLRSRWHLWRCDYHAVPQAHAVTLYRACEVANLVITTAISPIRLQGFTSPFIDLTDTITMGLNHQLLNLVFLFQMRVPSLAWCLDYSSIVPRIDSAIFLPLKTELEIGWPIIGRKQHCSLYDMVLLLKLLKWLTSFVERLNCYRHINKYPLY